jgi:hypothetical protein
MKSYAYDKSSGEFAVLGYVLRASEQRARIPRACRRLAFVSYVTG